MRLNFGKGLHGLPHFCYCSVAKWILPFHNDLHFAMAIFGSEITDYNYHFCNNYFCTCFLHWCAVFHQNNLKRNWGCSNKIKKTSAKMPICNMVIKTDYLATLMEAKITVELWESEICVGPFCAKSSQKWVGGRVISHLCQIFFLVTQMIQTERTGKKFNFYVSCTKWL